MNLRASPAHGCLPSTGARAARAAARGRVSLGACTTKPAMTTTSPARGRRRAPIRSASRRSTRPRRRPQQARAQAAAANASGQDRGPARPRRGRAPARALAADRRRAGRPACSRAPRRRAAPLARRTRGRRGPRRRPRGHLRTPASPAQPGLAAASELEAVLDALARGKLKRVGKLLHRMHPAKVAGLLEALPPAGAQPGLEHGRHRARRPRAHLPARRDQPPRSREELDPDDLDRRGAAPSSSTTSSTSSRPSPARARAAAACSPPPAARREQLESMLVLPRGLRPAASPNADAIAVRADVRAGTVLRYLRLLDTLPPQTGTLMVVDRKGHYRGALRAGPRWYHRRASTPARAALMQADLAGIPVDDARQPRGRPPVPGPRPDVGAGGRHRGPPDRPHHRRRRGRPDPRGPPTAR